MRLYGAGSVSTPARVVLDTLLLIVGLQVAAQALLVLVLLINPVHPIREYFNVTTVVNVPSEMWSPEGVVRVQTGLAAARVDPWAYVTYRPASRSFVAVAAAISFAWWACAVLVLLLLRRAFTNVSAGTPFPRANIRCVRGMGWAILGMAGLKVLISGVMFAFMRATTTIAGRPPAVPLDMLIESFPLGTFLAGAAVVILAEIFRAGADLQDDQSLTV